MTPELAMAAGVEYLRRVARDGRWAAFRLWWGLSDEWVSAYIAATLAEAGVPSCDGLPQQTLRAIAARQRVDGRFGFNEACVGDADSTLWTLRLAEAAGWPADFAPRRAAAERAMAAHVRAGGGVATYDCVDQIRRQVGAAENWQAVGWCAVHPCVTGAAAGAVVTAIPAAEYLLAHQEPDGSWPAYWWVDRDYSVANAAEALSGRLGEQIARALSRAGAWAGSRLGDGGVVRTKAYPEGSPFATALALRAVVAAQRMAGVRRTTPRRITQGRIDAAVAWLCSSVRLDGSWQPSAVLRVPHFADENPDRQGGSVWIPGGTTAGAVVVDRSAVFTTATVLAALARATA